MTGQRGIWRRFLGAALVAAVLAVGLSHPAAAEKRVAFVVGNSAYIHAPHLPNTVNDARATAAALRKLRFSVIEVLDADAAAMQRSLAVLTRELEGADLAIFYYAGHGMAIDGVNYVFPIDADLKTEADIDKQLVAVDDILGIFQARPLQIMVFLDACRNNPFYERVRRFGGRTVGRGLAKIEAVARRRRGGLAEMGSDDINMYVAFATQPGNLAADGLPGDVNSPFTKALLQNIDARIEVREMMTRVRASVVGATDGYQVPWDQSSLMRPVYLAGPPPKVKRPRVGVGLKLMPPP